LFGVIGVFYGINPSFAQIHDPTARNISIIFFTLSIAFYYYTAVLAYEKPPSVAKSLAKGSDKLAEKLDAMHGGDAS
jgi:hypothetical protein